MIDSEYRSGDEKWQFDGQLYLSDNGQEQGYGQWFRGVYSPKPGLEYGTLLRHADNKLDLNDMGYLERNDETRINFFGHQPEIADSPNFKTFNTGYWLDYSFNQAKERLNGAFGYWFNIQFNDLSFWEVAFHYNSNHWDDRNSRDNGSFRKNHYAHVWSYWQSDNTQAFSYGISAWARQAQINGDIYSIKPFINYAPTGNINITTELAYKKQDNWTLWQQDDLFNTFEQQRLKFNLKTTWIIDDAQEIRLAMQWLGLKAQSQQAYRINATGDLYQTGETPAEHFTRADLALQLRYKYQFAPLSDLYLVYSRGGDSFTEDKHNMHGFNRLLNHSFNQPNADQLTMKVRYRF